MKKILVGLLFLSSTAWGTYIPVNGSTVTVLPSNGGSFPIISSQTLKVDGSAVTQPVSGTVTANAGTGSFNVNQSTLAVMNVSGGKLLVTPDSVALPANQSVNISQINAVTPLMGAGNTGTGSPRVTVASDNAALAAWGQGATGGAVPSGAVYQGGIAKTALPTAATDGNLTGSLRDKFGRNVAILDCPRDLISVATATITSSTAETVFISSGAAGVFNDLVSVIAVNTSATATRLDFRSGTFGGTMSFALYLPAGDTRGLTTSHVWPQSTSASQWTVTSSASIADVRIYATYCADK